MTIKVEISGPVTTIILDRADKRNAVDRQMAAKLRAAILDFEHDDSQRAAVLWGDHGVFCAGADLSAMSDPDRIVEIEKDGGGGGPMGPSRLELSKPLIAAISGYAVAGGLELALFADMRVAEEDSKFGVFCRRWGVPLIDGGTVRLPRIIGMGRALDLILTGREINSQEALSFGLINRIVERGKSREAAEEIAQQLARFPQMCMLADRQSAYAQNGMTFAEAIQQEGKNGADIVAKEGAFGAARFVDGLGRHGSFDDFSKK